MAVIGECKACKNIPDWKGGISTIHTCIACGRHLSVAPQWYAPQPTTNGSVIQPEYYGDKDDPYEPFKVIRAWELNFFMGNVLKYIRRAGKKDSKLEAYRKAREYLDDEIRTLEAELAPKTDIKASDTSS